MYIVDPFEDLEKGTRTLPFAIICHPKTGTQSTREALRTTHKCRAVRGQHGFDLGEIEQVKDYGGVVCCAVRNPWDLMLSWYFYSEVGGSQKLGRETLPFLDWLPQILEKGNGWIEKGLFFADEHCDRIIRFEYDLETQLNNCLLDCGLTPIELPHAGKTEHKHYSHYYDIKTAVAVQRAFPREINEYGYQFEYGDDVPNMYYHQPGVEVGG